MKKLVALAGVAALGAAGAAFGTGTAPDSSIVVDLSGATSQGFQGDAINEHHLVGMAIGDVITSIDWDISLTFASPSWTEEVHINPTDGGAAIYTPSQFGGTGASGLQFFPGLQLTSPIAGSGSFGVLGGAYTMTTATLDVELHEWNFDDFAGSPDAFYGTGSSLTINYKAVPAPGALAVLGLAGLAGRRRRR